MLPLILGALLGLAAAPVLRAAATRHAVPAGEPPAVCPSCARRSRWLPPTGRCPGCAEWFGPAPLLLELAAVATGTAVGVAATGWRSALLLGWVALFAVVLAFVDAAVHRLPDPLTLRLGLGTAALLVLADLRHPAVLLRCAEGGALLGLLYAVLAVLGPMGLGDAKLALTLGGLLAWYGWRSVFDGALASFLLAAGWGLLLLVTGRAKAKDPLPFGPCMLLGALVAVLAAG
ncbi:prepilin peptidase [Kitasatospora sp. LaBMicrA B282]|uniref:prepilin peptidase n=1 Tax=Kitasatospora sp. LaBMicrA B282 TaxID=3420949 RepID=UPI003D0BAE3E